MLGCDTRLFSELVVRGAIKQGLQDMLQVMVLQIVIAVSWQSNTVVLKGYPVECKAWRGAAMRARRHYGEAEQSNYGVFKVRKLGGS